jgi:hypothetical protein
MPRSFYRQKGAILKARTPASIAAVWTRAYSPQCTLAVCVSDVEDGGRLVAVFEVDASTPARASRSIALVFRRLQEYGWRIGLEEDVDAVGRDLFERSQNLEIIEVGGRACEL